MPKRRQGGRRPTDPKIQRTFTARMNARLGQLGKRPEWLAGEIDRTGASVYAYKAGTTLPSLDVAAAIARALGVSLDWLTGRDE